MTVQLLRTVCCCVEDEDPPPPPVGCDTCEQGLCATAYAFTLNASGIITPGIAGYDFTFEFSGVLTVPSPLQPCTWFAGGDAVLTLVPTGSSTLYEGTWLGVGAGYQCVTAGQASSTSFGSTIFVTPGGGGVFSRTFNIGGGFSPGIGCPGDAQAEMSATIDCSWTRQGIIQPIVVDSVSVVVS